MSKEEDDAVAAAAAEAADFAAGFNAVRGIEPEPTDTGPKEETAAAAAAAPAAAAAAAAEANPFAGKTTEEIRAAFTAQQENRALKERLAQLEAAATAATAAAAKAAEGAAAGGSGTQGAEAAAGGTDGGTDDFEREFPDLARATRSMAEKLLKEKGFDPAIIQKVQDDNTNLRRETQELHLSATYGHGDWRNVLASQEYKDWLLTQPAEVQTTAANTPYAQDLAKVLDSFKATKKTVDPGAAADDVAARRAQKRLQAALTPKSGAAASAVATPSDEDEFRAGFNSVRGVR